MTKARTCIDCGREFHRRHGHICNTCTSARYRKRHGRKQQKQLAVRKVCGWCGVEYSTTHTKGRACSVTHGLWLHNHGQPARSTELTIRPPEPKIRVPKLVRPVREAPWWRIIVQGSCEWCGDAFTALSTTGIHRYCSDWCARRAGKARARLSRGRFAISDARRRRLYERDGWMCRICDEPTSSDWSEGDLWAPTLDHIEPQSSTLIPDHSDGNLRTAHAFCNRLRGDARLTDLEVRELALDRRCADVAA